MKTPNNTNDESTVVQSNINKFENVLRDTSVTLGQIVEAEMLSMGLDPKNQQDCEYFWKTKGLVE